MRFITLLLLSTIQILAITIKGIDYDFDEMFVGIKEREFSNILKNNGVDYVEEKANSGDPKFQFIHYIISLNQKSFIGPIDPIRKYLINSAEGGFVDAQSFLGYSYLEGEGPFPKNKELAYKWLSIAANKGHPMAQYGMGKIYIEGKIVDKDIHKAYGYIYKSSKSGFSLSDYVLAQMYYNSSENLGLDRVDSLKKALILLERSKKRGFKKAKKYIRLISYDLKKIYEKKNKDTFEELILIVKNNKSTDQFDLALHYLNGSGTNTNLRKAIDYLTLSAEQGYLNAQELLAVLYLIIGDSNLKDELRVKYKFLKDDRLNQRPKHIKNL